MDTDNLHSLSVDHARGLIGMSPSNQGKDVKLLVPTLYKEKKIPANMFALSINTQSDKPSMQLGGYYPEYAAEPLKWLPLTSINYWMFHFDSVSMGGK